MKTGSCLGAFAALVALVLLPASRADAQNLGLGTGSRSQSPAEDSAAGGRLERDEEPASTRRMNKRLGLSARRATVFDPKTFEARGRELQGQFYEIGTAADQRNSPKAPSGPGGEAGLQRKGRNQWMFWVGIAGLAGASAGAVGFVMMSKAHPSAPPPQDLVITDSP